MAATAPARRLHGRRLACLDKRARPFLRGRAAALARYVQAHHLDLEFYDRFFRQGAYLRTHAGHMQRWHSDAA